MGACWSSFQKRVSGTNKTAEDQRRVSGASNKDKEVLSSMNSSPALIDDAAHENDVKRLARGITSEKRTLESDYRIEKQKVLGTGFCGSVYLGNHKKTGEEVAVKSLSKCDFSSDDGETLDEVLERVRLECHIYMKCDHPNINRLRDLYETDTHIHIVSDCCKGGELYARLLSRVQYKEHDAALCMKGMLLAVNYLHENLNVVHRDIKLQNWLFPSEPCMDDEIKLIDFGFSKQIQTDTKLVATTAGTVEYLAPEMLHTRSVVSQKGDCWALGVILFMILGGYPPFSGKSNMEIIEAIRNYDLKWFKSRFSKVSKPALDLIKKLLHKDYEKRFTCKEALQHEWITTLAGGADNDSIDPEVIGALAGWREQSAFQKCISLMMGQCLSLKETQALQRAFLKLDVSQDGVIHAWELREAFHKNKHLLDDLFEETAAASDDGSPEKVNPSSSTASLGRGRQTTMRVDDEEFVAVVDMVFADLDHNNDTKIYFSDFVSAVIAKRLEKAKDDTLIDATFDRFDIDHSGFISVDNMQNLFGPAIGNHAVEVVLKEADTDGDGNVSREEFKQFIENMAKANREDILAKSGSQTGAKIETA